MVCAGGAASSAGGQETIPNPCLDPSLELRCPNLVMARPSDLHRDATTRRGHVLLRATSAIVDVGAGPAELRGTRSGPRTMKAQQVIYDTANDPHLFDTHATLDYKAVPGFRYGCCDVGFESYWKFRYAAVFQLWAVDAAFRPIRLVRTGPKLDYCLRDLVQVHRSAGSPPQRVYGACRQSRRLQRDTLGTSRGWADVYPYGYPEQWIDVTGLRGRYAFVQIADPRNHIWESNESDNVSEVYVSLPSARVLGSRTRAAGP